MTGETHGLDRILARHPFFDGMPEGYRVLIQGCAANAVVKAGDYVYREGEPADRFYLIREGRVALEVYVPGRKPIVVDTLGSNELMNWSWLLPPYRCHFDARALELTRLITLDAVCLRAKMDEDPVLGYAVYKRFAPVVAARLAAARRQLTDMYGAPGS
ncbi:MAG: cyclic nucleotide-binding domain-containing protein [Rhodospirillales bacterium]|nr:MAG: cyclic nucleotide-binding domain-containing protein [Rhodospirillales bacterium]